MWAAVVPRVRPVMRPRASGRQCGAPSPASAGTNTSSPESLTLFARASMSEAFSMRPRPSRSHCTAAPAMKALPSSAYCVSPPTRQATVVSSPCCDTTGTGPTFMSRKAPVP